MSSSRRAPKPFYKSAAFHAFAGASLTYDLILEPGAYAFAYRYVQTATGLATDVLLLGVVVVA